MESEYRRIVTIDSVDMIETRKVLAAFENTGLHALYSNSTIQGTGRHIYLGVDFRTPGQPPYSVQLAPNVGEWTGVTVGEFLLRIRPDLEGVPGEQTVLLFTEISAQGEGENQWNLIGTPSVQTAFDREATIQIGHQIDDGEPTISLTMVPRTSLN